jgi:dienelactone hydrolase
LREGGGVKTQQIEYRVDGKPFVGYLADGSNGRKTAGVLVAHEGGGMTEHPKERARMLAELGYVAFAMDTFGEPITSREQAMSVITQLSNDLATLRRRARTALDLLRAQVNVDPKRSAAIGFCFGGTTVLELARSGADLAGVVTFHGGLSNPNPEDAKKIKAKVLVLHGADDPLVAQKDIDQFRQDMRDAKVDLQFVAYSGTLHAFTNPKVNDPAHGVQYNELSDKRSWQSMRDFFKEIFKE